MSLVDEFQKQETKLGSIIEREDARLKIIRPTLVDEAISFDYSDLDTLPKETLEKYMGALSQYLIFLNRYVNILDVKHKLLKGLFDSYLDRKALEYEGKSDKERERKAKLANPEFGEAERIVFERQALLKLNERETDQIAELIKTIKKVYDVHTKVLPTNE